MVRDYNKANNLPDIIGLEQKIIDYICQEEPDYCASTEPPTMAEKARNFSRAMVDWVANGFKVITHEQFEERQSICNQCPYWRGESMLGYGSCAKCGCSGLKLYLPSQSCPDGRWKAINA